MSITRTMVINDTHHPFHDPRSVNLVLDILEDTKLDRLILNGDILDFYSVSRYQKSPDIQVKLEVELDCGLEFIQSLRKRFPKLEIVYLFGNHEARLNNYIINTTPAFWNLIKIESHLQLERYNIEHYKYQDVYQIEKSNCFVVHSPPSYGQNGARTSLLKKLDQTFIYGCTHREQKACIMGASGEVHAAYFNGWLGSVDLTPDHKEVFAYTKGHHDWQQCFCIVTVVDKKEFLVNQYSIRNHKVCVDGYLYEG